MLLLLIMLFLLLLCSLFFASYIPSLVNDDVEVSTYGEGGHHM